MNKSGLIDLANYLIMGTTIPTTAIAAVFRLSVWKLSLLSLIFLTSLYVDGQCTVRNIGNQNNADEIYFKRVQFGTIDNVQALTGTNRAYTTASPYGYQNYTSMSTDVVRGENVVFTFTTDGDADNKEQQSRFAIFVDWNNDGDFTDAGERIFLDQTEYNTTFSYTYKIPNDAPLGARVIRFKVRYDWMSNNPCLETWENQVEVEDYTMNIVRPDNDTFITSNNILVADGSTEISGSNNTNFGSFDISAGAVDKTFTIINGGLNTLNLTGAGSAKVTITGDPEFTIVTQPTDFSLTSDETTTFTIRYDPASVGTHNAVVSIPNSDPIKNPYNFAIGGEGKQTFPDTDGDGITDNIDIDDDNDGILDSVEQTLCELVPSSTSVTIKFLEETFGQGTTKVRINDNNPAVTTTYPFEDNIEGISPDEVDSEINVNDGEYTVTNSAQITSWAADFWHLGGDHTGNTNGRFALFNAAIDAGEFYKTEVDGIIANVPITYSFWALNLDTDEAPCLNGCPGGDTWDDDPRLRPRIRVEFRDEFGNLIASKSTGDIAPTDKDNLAGDWYEYSETFTPTVTKFTITFINDQPGGLGNDLGIDDILITQQLCDVDGDGVADVIDIDNDNDGIPNVIEIGKPSAVTTIDPDNDATTFNSNGGTEWKDTNNDGLHDDYKDYVPQDSDGDGIPNYLDLDSDNDGIFDVLENDGFGDLDTDGDGRGEGLDIEDGVLNDGTDGDGFLSGRLSTDIGDEGILTDFDNNDEDAGGNSDDHGTSSYNLPKDTDGDGIPDYLDLYSDDATNSDPTKRDILDSYYAALDNGSGQITATTDTDRDGVNDSNNDFDTTIYGAPINLNDSYTIDFDGRNDYIELDNPLLSNTNAFTLMAWVLIDEAPTNRATIMSGGSLDLDINNQLRVRARVTNAAGNVSAVNLNAGDALSIGKWYHVAAMYDAPNELFNIYINGMLKKSVSIANAATATTTDPLRIGRRAASTAADQYYFDGSIDEVRIFNNAIDEEDMRRIVYQEIDQNGTKISGKFLVKDVDVNYTDLLAYFPFTEFIRSKMSDQSVNLENATMYNIKSILPQSAPLPYVTSQDGRLDVASTYVYDTVWDPADLENTTAGIVHVKHDVTQRRDYQMIGLQIDTDKTVTVEADHLIENSWQLNLDGTLELLGDSQLVQTMESTLNAGSNGKLLRSQSGLTSPYSYNYWSSPIVTQELNTSAPYFFLNEMLDGQDGAPVNFTTNKTPGASDPLTISSNWLYTFVNGLTYNDWTRVNPSTTRVYPGIGWSQKGSSNSVTSDAVMLFSGRPNNGTISINAAHPGGQNPIVDNVTSLVGNPYPSAIDAREFIKDNVDATDPTQSVINGTLYLWEQFRPTSHILTAYEGGYATITALGTTAASQYDGYGLGTGNTGETSLVAPTFNIPVAQGFYVTVNAPGTINFYNSQRTFKTHMADNTVFFAAPGSDAHAVPQDRSNKQDVNVELIRLNFESNAGAKREVLLGFDDQFTTGHDMGYDGLMAGAPGESDLYITYQNKPYVIRALPTISSEQIIDLGVHGIAKNNYRIEATEFQNIDQTQPVYLWDKELGVYHDLGIDGAYEFTLTTDGINKSRFALTFAKGTLSSDTLSSRENTTVYQESASGNLYLKTNDNTITEVVIFDLTGKELLRFRESELDRIKSGYNVSGVATGIYLAQIYRNSDYTAVKFAIE